MSSVITNKDCIDDAGKEAVPDAISSKNDVTARRHEHQQQRWDVDEECDPRSWKGEVDENNDPFYTGSDQYLERFPSSTAAFDTASSDGGGSRLDLDMMDEDDNRSHDAHHFELDHATQRDTKKLRFLKVSVGVILLLSALIIADNAFKYITRNEKQQFRTSFESEARKLFETIGSQFDQTIGSLNLMAVMLVSHAHNQGNVWPFVTLPDFALHASKLIPLTQGLFVTVLPMVYPSNKQTWEDYAFKEDYWVNESLALQKNWNGYHGDITFDWVRSEAVSDGNHVIDDNVTYVCICRAFESYASNFCSYT
jgi:hypothetical protein